MLIYYDAGTGQTLIYNLQMGPILALGNRIEFRASQLRGAPRMVKLRGGGGAIDFIKKTHEAHYRMMTASW